YVKCKRQHLYLQKLGLTFHKFPMDRPSLLKRWLKATGRPHFYPAQWSSVCSVHFTDDCFDRSGGRVELRPDAVPTMSDSPSANL
uniref:THAP domain-containing protein 1 n=1 Tax=Neogobius melanostomus TaxID=47308 RepID=A0A8C6WQ62_9GOBI